jgi:predicted nucleic acid-binding protein
MSEVVADNCALVHAQQMGVLAVPPMPLVEALLTTGALRLVTAKAVRGELSQGLEAVVSAWQEAGWLRVEKVGYQQVRALRNMSRRPMPGDHDLALIALAQALSAPLLTHDAPAQHFALDRGVGVTVIDLLDLVLWACRRGAAQLDAVSVAWGAQPHPEWPRAWAGSVEEEAKTRRPGPRGPWVLTGGPELADEDGVGDGRRAGDGIAETD